MIDRRGMFGGAFALFLAVQPGQAGPCTHDIDRVQAQVDARIEAIAGTGPAGPETQGARLHHQPTPESMADAEQRLGEGKVAEAALAALIRARSADAAGDKAACDQALAEAMRAIAP